MQYIDFTVDHLIFFMTQCISR